MGYCYKIFYQKSLFRGVGIFFMISIKLNFKMLSMFNTVLMLDLEKNLIFSPLLSYSSNFVTNFAVAC